MAVIMVEDAPAIAQTRVPGKVKSSISAPNQADLCYHQRHGGTCVATTTTIERVPCHFRCAIGALVYILFIAHGPCHAARREREADLL